MVVPDGFVWQEYADPRKVYEDHGYNVTVAGKTLAELKSSAGPVKPNISFEQVDLALYDGLSFVGGSGAWRDFFPNSKIHDIIKSALARNKVVGLLCAATGVLGFVNGWDGEGHPIAEGKTVVGYYQVEGILKKLARVKFDQTSLPTVADGLLVTGRNPEASTAFAEKIIQTIESRNSHILK